LIRRRNYRPARLSLLQEDIAMMKTWIVSADAGRARIFQSTTGSRQIDEIADFVNPSAREPARDLVTDADGRVYAHGGRGQPSHASAPRADPVEHETELFAKRVAEAIDEARKAARFDDLCLVAAPKFLGLLRANLDKETRKLARREIDKDLSQKSAAEILAYVQDR
jgi:protein required for attachment to host cells